MFYSLVKNLFKKKKNKISIYTSQWRYARTRHLVTIEATSSESGEVTAST